MWEMRWEKKNGWVKELASTVPSRKERAIFVMKIVSLANPISCQLNPTLWNILKFYPKGGEGDAQREGVECGEQEEKKCEGKEHKQSEGVVESRNGNKAQLKFCCCSPSE